MTRNNFAEAAPVATISVMLVDDHRLFRAALRCLLERDLRLRVVSEATTVAEAVQAMHDRPADLVVMDVHLPDGNGVTASQQLLESFPQLKVLAVTSDPSARQVHDAMVAGISGYILKENTPEEFVRAVQAVLAGNVYLCPEVSTSIVANYRHRYKPEASAATAALTLSPRETELLRQIADGRRNKEIADNLGLTLKSAETYRQRLMKKLDLDSTAALTRYAVREGIVEA